MWDVPRQARLPSALRSFRELSTASLQLNTLRGSPAVPKDRSHAVLGLRPRHILRGPPQGLSACTDWPFGSPASSSPRSSLYCALSHWGPLCGRHLEPLLPHSLPSNVSLHTHWQCTVSHTWLLLGLPPRPGLPSPGSSEAPQPVAAVPRFPAQPGPGRPLSGRHLSPSWISFPRSSCPVILSVSFRPGTASPPREPETSEGRQGVARTWRPRWSLCQ